MDKALIGTFWYLAYDKKTGKGFIYPKAYNFTLTGYQAAALTKEPGCKLVTNISKQDKPSKVTAFAVDIQMTNNDHNYQPAKFDKVFHPDKYERQLLRRWMKKTKNKDYSNIENYLDKFEANLNQSSASKPATNPVN